ncbi:hypothetical protein F5B21DRAFT_506531 [Xylaria acuta]|nr:hypothetical protein F5B21DRAFT_506531 [Xylaria acuta]
MSPISERIGTVRRATPRATPGQDTITSHHVPELAPRNGPKESELVAIPPIKGVQFHTYPGIPALSTPPCEHPIDEELPSYESIRFQGPPTYTRRPPTPPTQSPTRASSSTGLLARLRSLLRSHRDRSKTPDTEHQHTQHLIEQVETELGLLRDVQSATTRANEMDAALKLERETCSPAEIAQKLGEREKLGNRIDDTYRKLNTIAEADFSSEWRFMATPRITVLDAKLRRLGELDKAQQDLPNIEKRIEDLGIVMASPRYSGMSQSMALKMFNELLRDKGALIRKVTAIKGDIARFDRGLENLLTQYMS